MLFMVIERFRDSNAAAVYRCFREKGRMLPEGLNYVDSWVEVNLERCFQLLECNDARLLQEWIAQWHDLIEFEVLAVTSSKEATEVLGPLL